MSNDSKPKVFTSGGETALRVTTSILAWGSWIGAVSIFAYATWQYNPNKGDFAPQWVGFSFILLIGVAIAASAARSRQKLSDTVLGAFQAGLIAQREQSAELAEQVQAQMRQGEVNRVQAADAKPVAVEHHHDHTHHAFGEGEA